MRWSPFRRRFLAPEVIQTSSVDCGPAALKCVLGGFHIHASFGRLREACQTQLDGTSIDAIEDIAGRLGLEAEQVVVPLDHVFLKGTKLFPAIAIADTPSGMLHFIVLWRKIGRWIQVMDPQIGRRWVSGERLASQLHVHSAIVDSDSWREWAEGESNQNALKQRAKSAGIRQNKFLQLLRHAREDASWKGLGLLDGAIRMVTELVKSNGINKGRQATRLTSELIKRAEENGIDATIPGPFRSVLPFPDSEDAVSFKGAVLLSVQGRSAASHDPDMQGSEIGTILSEPDPRPLSMILGSIFAGGYGRPVGMIIGLVALAALMMAEAILLRGLLSLAGSLAISTQRLIAGGMVIGFFVFQAAIEFIVQSELLRLGRALEARLRIRFLSKIRTIGLSYFQSRPTSDLADRCHNMHSLRIFPAALGQIIRSTSVLCATTCGLLWLVPTFTTIILSLLSVALAVPLLLQPLLSERDLRFRTQSGALTRFYLDALLGLAPIRSHSAENSVLVEHEAFLVDWRKTGLQLLVTNLGIQTVEALIGIILAMAAVALFATHHNDESTLLLLAFWAMSLPGLAQSVADSLLQYPALRSVSLRLLEPLGAADEALPVVDKKADAVEKPQTLGVAISMQNIELRAGGSIVLKNVNLDIEPGSHVAIVGQSGSGKSSLIGLLLGWRRPSVGALMIDGEPIDVRTLRQQTAWIDPAIQLWNRSLFENVDYGAIDASAATLGFSLTAAELNELIARLSDGMQTVIGENGAMTSGGEGQRVRLARALMRPAARLVILDEAFRGLDRSALRRLLQQARKVWPQATLLCVTHDVQETKDFERVLVVEDGAIIEDGSPNELAEIQNSRYSSLLEAEESVDRDLWQATVWRRWTVHGGCLDGQSKKDIVVSDSPSAAFQGVHDGLA